MRSPETFSLRPHTHLPARTSVTNTSFLTATLITGLLAGSQMRHIAPIPQPKRFPSVPLSALATAETEKPDPKAPMVDLLQRLRTVEEYQEFIAEHGVYCKSRFPFSFFWNYRQAPEALQANGFEGSCNHFAETAAEWSYRHGGTPYIVSLCPKGWKKAISPWHQFTVVKLDTGKLVIFDERELHTNVDSLTGYLKTHYPRMTTMNPGGIIEWQLAENATSAKIAQHFMAPEICEEDFKPSTLPFRPKPKGQQEHDDKNLNLAGILARIKAS